MTTAISLRPEMGEAVLAHLGKIAELPKFGVLAGQAVASAIEDLWGPGGGVYNDLDVFIPSTGKYNKGELKATRMPERGQVQSVTSNGYGEGIQRHLKLVQTYRIDEVRYSGMLNRIYFRLPSGDLRTGDHTLRIISGFDINAVRVGLDLRTRKLVWDKHYEQFLATRELRIAACYTPAHSLIRILKKSEELPNVHLDLDTAARITAMLQADPRNAKRMTDSFLVSFLFGEKFSRLAEAYRAQWQDYYSLEDVHFHRASDKYGWSQGAGDETSVDFKELHRMAPRGELEPADQEFARALGMTGVVYLPEQVYRDRDCRSKSVVPVSGIALKDFAEIYAGSAMVLHAEVCGPNAYLAGISGDYDKLAELDDFTKSARSDYVLGLSGLEQLEFSRRLTAFEQSIGVPDATELLDQALQEAQPLSLARVEELVNLRLTAQRLPGLSSSIELPSLSACSSAHGLTVRELISEREVGECAKVNSLYLGSVGTPWSRRYFFIEGLNVDGDVQCAIWAPSLNADGKMNSDALLVFRVRSFLPEATAERERIKAVVDWLAASMVAQGLMADGIVAKAPAAAVARGDGLSHQSGLPASVDEDCWSPEDAMPY